LDFGEARIGVAVSDPLRLFAQGVAVVCASEGWEEELASLLKRYEVELVLVGVPIREDGQPSHQAAKVLSQAEALIALLPEVRFAFVDERYTTKLAHSYLREVGRGMRRAKELSDMVAAEILLQEYLDAQRKEGSDGER